MPNLLMKTKRLVAGLMILFVAGCGNTVPMENLEDGSEAAAPPAWVYPIENFPERVTLKPFGIYITPQTSPVQPERFTGYHTGADAETTATEKLEEVWIYAIATGEVVLAREADGYGGVLAIQHEVEGESYVAIYGHLDLGNLKVSVGDSVTAGQTLGVLGEGFSNETDGERKHLHFALKAGTTVDLKGYVQTESELQEWIDPLVFFN